LRNASVALFFEPFALPLGLPDWPFLNGPVISTVFFSMTVVCLLFACCLQICGLCAQICPCRHARQAVASAAHLQSSFRSSSQWLGSAITQVSRHKSAARTDTMTRQSNVTGSPGADRKEAERPSIVHPSLYLPEPVYEALRKIAFKERLKIHDVVLEGIDLALRRRRYPSAKN
jgi:hypothetical protein